MLIRLVANSSLSQEQADNYRTELAMLHNYATAFGLTTRQLEVTTLPDNDPHQTMEKTVELTIPAGYNGFVQLAAPGTTISISNVNGDGENQPVVDFTTNMVTLNNKTYITQVPEVDSDGNQTMVDKEVPCEKPAKLTVTYLVDFGSSQSVTAMLMTNDGTQSKSGTLTFALNPTQPVNNAVGQTHFEYLTKLFGQIDTLTQLINFIYGNPNDDSLLKQFATTDTSTPSDYQNFNANSVYKRYGNITLNSVADRLDRNDVNDFQQMGQTNLQKLIDTITNLQDEINQLKDDEESLSNNLPNNYFSTQLGDLQKWYDTATELNDTTHNSWKTTQANLLTVKNWQQYSESDPSLYIDPTTGDTLYKSISDMMTTSSKDAKEISDNAKAIKDNANQFNDMVDGVNATKSDTQKVLNGTGGLLQKGNDYLKKSNDYYKNFETLLANTRTPGVNTNSIFGFFAQPLQPKNVTPEKTTKIEQKPNLTWIPALVGGIAIGGVGMYLMRRKNTPEN
ncbi:Uncharacterized conserved membrane protein, YUEB B.subtilis homolog [Lactococcus lactis subsp. lactis A12]|uniref:Uncharacterized conserved membrane protein, YUEB B.subtilis homolog n=1 Tax=Lactococcus lactis subsp. lactis A12 TaxID=1137134 RepID=S6FRR1_LACLL|nr:Uncharacterized conserved membrane protein, YUEB B.subtilis homolog [Lactococcus lactis subsp. lactis A12]